LVGHAKVVVTFLQIGGGPCDSTLGPPPNQCLILATPTNMPTISLMLTAYRNCIKGGVSLEFKTHKRKEKGHVECIHIVCNWEHFSIFWHKFRDFSVINCRSSGTETKAGCLGDLKVSDSD
jgi:hypothetical protein